MQMSLLENASIEAPTTPDTAMNQPVNYPYNSWPRYIAASRGFPELCRDA